MWSVLIAARAPGTQAPLTLKEQRTAAQKKIDSRLLQAIARQGRGGTRAAVPATPVAGVRIDRKQRALVDIRVDVTSAFQKKLTRLGATIVTTSIEYHSVVAWVALRQIEALAADDAVRAIVPAPEPAIHR